VWGGLLGGLAAICGHNWSLFLGFRGGKGVATAFGVLLAISPLVALILMVIWIVAVAVTRISSVGSLLAAGLAPVVAWLVGLGWPQILFALAAGTMVIWRHKANIKRLLAGTELRIGDRV
ncbi:MAG: acyl-phosphate glycerol 3-phosphate acyltransferase, partial [Firmicutes bacterium]|nr:acyl-phosphate glycerol 3-phosphate acyltransferase [Bacillota bacterium]